MKVKIVSTRKDLDTAEKLVIDAFMDYPLYVYLFPDEKQRRKGIPAVMGAFWEHAYADRTIGLADGNRGAIAWLLPQSQKLSLRETLSIVRGIMKYGGWLSAVGKIRYMMKFEASRIPDDHIYPLCAAVNKSFRGEGCSHELLQCMYSHTESYNLPYCAETAKDENVEIWGKAGFEVYGHFRHPKLDQFLLVKNKKAT